MKYSLYSIARFGDMMADHVRMAAYAGALERAVTPGCTVLDLGTGTGIFALLACRFGAGRVYAVDPDDSIAVARDAAKANGMDDRISFIQGMSTELVLPERVDVIISDLRGVLPLFHHHIPSIIDARERFLTPGGTLIPLADTLRAAIVSDAAEYDRYVGPWERDGYGLNMDAARTLVTNTWNISRVAGDALVTEPATVADLDYATITEPNLDAKVTWTVRADTTAHGLTLWFDAQVGDGFAFSNAPGGAELLYGRAFLPWTRPIELNAGDNVTVQLRADLLGDDYVWRWNTRVENRDGVCTESFEQSELQGVPLDLDDLLRGTPEHVPQLAHHGVVDRAVLNSMDGTSSLAAIATQVATAFPQRFSTQDAALAHVRDISRRYGS